MVVRVSVCVCLSVCLSVFLSVCLSVCLLQGSLMRHALAGQTQKLATIDDWDNYETMM